MCVSLLIDKTLNEKGSKIFEHIKETILSDSDLYELFVNVVAISEVSSVTDFASSTISVALKTEQVRKVYSKLVKQFLKVMMNQFGRDILDSFNVTKKMAHRKQVRVKGGKSALKGKGKDNDDVKSAQNRKDSDTVTDAENITESVKRG